MVNTYFEEVDAKYEGEDAEHDDASSTVSVVKVS